MIYVGYPCIGKTSIAGRNNFIDLESSLFNDGSKDGAEKYVKVASDLSAQGYAVFVSSHKIVREVLKKSDIPFICVFPSLRLKSQGYDKLAARYKLHGSEKNLRALARWHCFDDDIKDLMTENRIMIIRDIDYELKDFISTADVETPYTADSSSNKTITDLGEE